MSKPEMPYGYLGAQGKFKEWGLSTVNHNSPEITTNTANAEIKIKISNPMRVTANLIACGSDEEHKDLVFTQTYDNTVSLMVNLPAAGYFKLQIFALLAMDDSKSLPNVFNYLIHNTSPPKGAVIPFPKQFAQWKDGCFLCEPLHLCNADHAHFKVYVPGAKAVAVTVDTEWFPLKQASDGSWQGEVKGLQRLKSKTQKASLNANYGGDETKYTSLLEFTL